MIASKRIKFLVSFFAVFIAAFVFGQEIRESVKVELVQVDVTARDSKGAFVRDLTADDFILRENGTVQKITHFFNSSDDSTRYPLTVSFLIDTSYSMHDTVAGMTRIDIAVKAAELVMEQLKAGDQVEVIEFDKEPREVIPFTREFNAVRERFEYMESHDANTALNDSILLALKNIQDLSGRKIILIFSDGMDTASKSVQEDVIDALHKSDAIVVAFYSEFARLNLPPVMGGNQNRIMIRAGEDALRSYAETSGGEFFSFGKEAELTKAMDQLRALITSQYTLAYSPPPSERSKSKWRKIKVECKRKGVKLTFREGYYAS
jgi:VWFA-related protein